MAKEMATRKASLTDHLHRSPITRPGSDEESEDSIADEAHGLITGGEPMLHSRALGPRLRRAASVAAACLLYLSIGPSLIIVNRAILKDRAFNYPMAVSGLGLLCSTAVSFTLVHCRCVRREHANAITLKFYVYNLLPIGAALATTLAAGNAVYMYLPVGFIQMLKAFTPAVIVAECHRVPRLSFEYHTTTVPHHRPTECHAECDRGATECQTMSAEQ